MKTLDCLENGHRAIIHSFSGKRCLVGRVMAIGLTMGVRVIMVQNTRFF